MKVHRRLLYLSCIALTMWFAVFMASNGHAAEIKLMSSGGLKVALIDLIPAFERATRHKITATYGAPSTIRDRVLAGEPMDVLVLPTPWLDDLVKQDKIAANSKI